MNENIKLKLASLPDSPGVYQYYNKKGDLLYIGKAKNLKRRVSSYFNKQHDSKRLRVLVSNIETIETINVNSEYDALLLENNLIKEHKPRYNILLKDDKTYPWICIKNERFPRIFSTRNVIKDGSEYFGPYSSVKTMKVLLGLIKELYQIRTCSYDLSEKNIENDKYKVCLEYHIGNCLGPCEGYQTEEEYNEQITAIRNIIKGEFNEAKQYLIDQMIKYASELKFEKAQIIKEKIESLQNYQARSTIVSPTITNVDVFSISSDEEYAYVNFMKIYHGAIIQSYTEEWKKKLDETDEDLLERAIIDFSERFNLNSKEIYVPFELNLEIPNRKITVPKIGDKKHIIDLSLKNTRIYRLEQLKQTKIVDPDRHTNRIMNQMKIDLRLPAEPRHIEGFDNSNIQGTNPVSACVVFKNGKPSKKDYRIFNVKTVEGPNDFATMEEVIERRYTRVIAEGEPLPQLILIDGGKGQLSSALKSLDRLGLRGKVSVIGIAKRLEEIYYPDDPYPLYLDKNSETLKVLQHVRDESHRYGITNHRNRRSKNAFNSVLEEIDGIGPQTIKELLTNFKSVERIKNASLLELTDVIGKSKAKKVKDYFSNEKPTN
ncbi:excinuclease ABC subunit C [Algoriella xinjiangensis]|uniref:UvrABC system protein C n=1 Tax=Algoriella xinjiangensis TaxID=684065 RepID=A0A1I4TAJ4_9FLAO|nr:MULTISPECIES: excinuclease ABC subunit UvrC [Algoriella]MBO6211753.1 excinuclease ABC subunit UvrC [Algoriella sp.]SFM73706.1 excinuclease ABC subunit C [Algoriella xinjiangensis]VDH15038.1 Excinuclease ABC subunit C [Algoriella xinjiangensis]